MEDMEPTVVIQPIIFENVKFNTPTATANLETDSVIIFNGKHRISINKSLMMERCTFFNYMSKHGFKEANANEISIGYNTDVTVFKALVDYIHTGKIQLTTANLEAVIVAAIYFQLHALLKFCCDVMMQNTDVKTVGQVYEFAKELALVDLRKAAVEFEVKHFNNIAKSNVFYEWIATCMLELLSSDEIEVSHEKKVLKFVLDWLNVDPNHRSEHATELFRKLRFTFINKKIMKEVVVENSIKKLCPILHQVASEFENKITPPRVYDKGMYMYGYNPKTSYLLGDRGYCFVRYCPDDGNITVLKRPSIGPNERRIGTAVVNNKDIFMLIVNKQHDSWKIEIKTYDAKKDEWKSKASTTIEREFDHCLGRVSVCDEKVFGFISAVNRGQLRSLYFCIMYSIKTNTWQHLPAFEGKCIRSATTCGDSIYMTFDDSTNLLQYKPSTGELIDIPCQYDLGPWVCEAIAYKSSILFLHHQLLVDHPQLLPLSMARLTVLFNTETKEFRSFDFTEMYKTNGIFNEKLCFSLFRDVVFVFTKYSEKVFKIDLSFTDESKEPTLIPLPDISGMRMNIQEIVSIP